MVAEGASLIVWTIYFRFISQNAYPFLYFTTILNFVTAFLSWFIPETPRYLFGMEQYDKCREVLALTARRNGVKNYVPPRFEEEYDVYVEDLDQNAKLEQMGPSQQKKGGQFAHLLDAQGQTERESRKETSVSGKKRYVTQAGVEMDRLTKRETVALMH
jgi:hypothetical protein